MVNVPIPILWLESSVYTSTNASLCLHVVKRVRGIARCVKLWSSHFEVVLEGKDPGLRVEVSGGSCWCKARSSSKCSVLNCLQFMCGSVGYGRGL